MSTDSRHIAVIDLKAFYSYVECIERGLDPWTTPLVVADKERGKNTIVLSVSPFLKKEGVPSRLRIQDLPKKYNYIYAVPRMQKYIDKSAEVVNIFMEFISYDDIHVYSIDEAFLDLTSYLQYYQMTPIQIVQKIIRTIEEKLGLSATAGIGGNFFLAKVALDIYAKKEKNGIATMYKDDVPNKLWPITPLNKIWGIGSKTEAKLNRLGIFNMKDLAFSDKNFMINIFGIIGEQLINHANGIDEADIHEQYIPKSTSLTIGQVLFKDYNKNNITTIIREMCDDLSERLRHENKQTSLVSLFIGYSKDKGGFSRQMSLLNATDDTHVLFQALIEIFNKHIIDEPIRHVGLSFGKLQDIHFQQLNIFEDEQKQIKRKDLLKTIDKIHNRYGKNILLRASALTEDSTIKERHNQIGGHRK